MMEKYYYSLYGLNIKSDFKLLKVLTINDNKKIDVVIKNQIMPEYIKKAIENGKRYSFNKIESWFIIKDIAIYRIINGKEIDIEVLNGTSEDIEAFLLGTAFGCIFIQRNIVAIHGSTVIINEIGIIITGDMGAGKSTLTSGLLVEGCKFLSDDISAISQDKDGIILVSPAYPSQKLCRDAAIKFGLNVDILNKTDEERDKFFVPSSESFVNEKKKIEYIFEISLKDEDDKNLEIQIEELNGFLKLKGILKNVYREPIARTIGMNPVYFKNIVSIAENIKYYKITRPRNLFTIDLQKKAVMEKISR